MQIVLAYPEELHVLHNAYSLAPEKTWDQLIAKKILKYYKISSKNVKKLTPDLNYEEKYVLSEWNWQKSIDCLKVK